MAATFCSCRPRNLSCCLGRRSLAILQARIRNSDLAPDWLRIGTDILNNTTPPPTFNMTFSLL